MELNTIEICGNCKHHTPQFTYRECENGYGHIYPNDHGCWQWKERATNKKAGKRQSKKKSEE